MIYYLKRIYNVADGVFKWENKTELSFYYRTKDTFLGNITKNHYKYPKLICVGKNINTMEYILNAKNNGIKKIFDTRSNYDNIFYLDSSKFAPQQLKYYIDDMCRDDVNERINKAFSVADGYNKFYSETEDKTIVVNCTTCNLVAIRFIKEFSIKEGRKINVICLDFQLPYLKEYFGTGENTEYYKIYSTDILDI